jgi:hypothetical protein
MKRRDFIVASGSTVLSGLATSQIQRSAIGLDFEISTPDKDPSKVDSLVIAFEKLEITPKYLDESEPVNVQGKVEVGGRIEKSNEVQTSVVNGGTKNLENDVDSIVLDGLNTSSTISGDVTVSIDHPDIQDSYSRQFYVNGSEIPDSRFYNFESGDSSGWNSLNDLSADTGQVYAGSYSGLIDSIQTGTYHARDIPSGYLGGLQPEKFIFYLYHDGKNSSGSGMRLINSNGNVEFGGGDDSTAVFVDGGNGTNVVDGTTTRVGPWREYKFIINWENSEFTATITETDTSTEIGTVTEPLKQGLNIESVQIDAYHSGDSGWQSGFAVNDWYDEIGLYATA